MRESYKRFVKTWIRFANPWIRIVVTNADSKKISFVSWLTNPTSQFCESRFASPILKDLNHGFVLWPELPKIRPVFTNPHKSWRILSTIAPNESLRIQAGGLANLDLRIRTLRIRIENLIRRPFFKRFVSWIRFVGLFSKDWYLGFVL